MEGDKTLEKVGELESPSDWSGKAHAVEAYESNGTDKSVDIEIWVIPRDPMSLRDRL